ncbi:TPA: hypothetical protein NJ223_004628 [Vibrio parahaemolyticus]|nr:hypothetical protein [Vibrio alginolyticus]HCE2343430.1 hypothetical protein [Vibrio parahaemolyticus]HCE4652106.1 hypothetical protein [Vibrio parahaemolyticus]HCG6612616.1 hypothetical protein [Vibrio parahaemolyticus]HCG9483762.1 hypothetical protein [Vibrio parahaemolyticus]
MSKANKTQRAVPGHKYRIGFGCNQFEEILDASNIEEKHPNVFVRDAGIEEAEKVNMKKKK